MIATPISRGVVSFAWAVPASLGPPGGGGEDSAGVAVPVGAGVGPVGASVEEGCCPWASTSADVTWTLAAAKPADGAVAPAVTHNTLPMRAMKTAALVNVVRIGPPPGRPVVREVGTGNIRGRASHPLIVNLAMSPVHHRRNGGRVPSASQPGSMVRADRNRLLVAVGAELLHLPYRLSGEAPVTGDWAWMGPNRAGDRQILAALPRRSELSRKRAFEDSSEAQILAADMDMVGVVVPVDRPLTHNRLERTLVAAWDSGATPLVIITKADLADVADDVVGKVILQAAGVEVATTSAENGDGIDGLLNLADGHPRCPRLWIVRRRGRNRGDVRRRRGAGGPVQVLGLSAPGRAGLRRPGGDHRRCAGGTPLAQLPEAPAGTGGSGAEERRRRATRLPAGVAPEGAGGRKVAALGGA